MTTVTTPSATEGVLVDSSGWLEYITADTKADLFAPYFESESPLLVPTIVLYEVRKILLLKQRQTLADIFVSEALRRTVIPFDESIALKAAFVSVQHQLAMADAIVYTTAEANCVPLVTSDTHFTGLPGVTVL
jgi:predicted nucleic acid-binding protein